MRQDDDFDDYEPKEIKPSKTLCDCGSKISFNCDDKCRVCYYGDIFKATPIESHLMAAGTPRKVARKTAKCYAQSFLNKKAYHHTNFIESFNTSVFLHGEPGSGKTTFAVALMIDHMQKWNTEKEYFKKNQIFLFTTIPEMIQDIRLSFKLSHDEEVEVFNKYKNADFLILDDFGVEKTTDWAFSVLYLIISHRYEEDKITVFTSNYDLDQIVEKNNDERITRRILDWCTILELTK